MGITSKVSWGISAFTDDDYYQLLFVGKTIYARKPFFFTNNSDGRAFIEFTVDSLLKCKVPEANLYKYLIGWEYHMEVGHFATKSEI